MNPSDTSSGTSPPAPVGDDELTHVAQSPALGGMRRRAVLRLMAAGAAAGTAAVWFPFGPARAALRNALRGAPQRGFLTSAELAILDAATARIVPTDTQPGARECAVVDYIQAMLSFMPGSDANCDHQVTAADVTATLLAPNAVRTVCSGAGDVDGNGSVDAADTVTAEAAVFQARPVYAGGPFSDRNPQSHFPIGPTACATCHSAAPQTGPPVLVPAQAGAVDAYAPNAFREHLPVPRLRLLSWKIRLLGATSVPEVADNPLATDMLEVDLRRKYRDGLASLDTSAQQRFGAPFVQLTPVQQSTVMERADQAFVELLTAHTVEGMLCAPEYGGNRDRIGWQLVGYDGDSQPQGYVVYDPTVPGNYRERPDKPNSGPNPDEDCHGFSAAMNSFLNLIAINPIVQPGRRFPAPYCFDVSA